MIGKGPWSCLPYTKGTILFRDVRRHDLQSPTLVLRSLTRTMAAGEGSACARLDALLRDGWYAAFTKDPNRDHIHLMFLWHASSNLSENRANGARLDEPASRKRQMKGYFDSKNQYSPYRSFGSPLMGVL